MVIDLPQHVFIIWCWKTLQDMIWRSMRHCYIKLQHGSRNTNTPCHLDQTENRRGSTGRAGYITENVNSNSSSWIKLSCKSASSFWSRFQQTAMEICQQKLRGVMQSFQSPLSTTPIEDVPFCRFYFVINHPPRNARPSCLHSMRLPAIFGKPTSVQSQKAPMGPL